MEHGSFKIPQSAKEINDASPDEQKQIGQFFGQLFAQGEEVFMKVTGYTKDKMKEIFKELIEGTTERTAQRARRPSPEQLSLRQDQPGLATQAAQTIKTRQVQQEKFLEDLESFPVPVSSVEAGGTETPKPRSKFFKLDVSDSKTRKSATIQDEPGPFEIIVREVDGEDEIVSMGGRARLFFGERE